MAGIVVVFNSPTLLHIYDELLSFFFTVSKALFQKAYQIQRQQYSIKPMSIFIREH